MPANSASFAIDIAASFTDGAATIAELDRMADELAKVGTTADGFDAALAQVANELNTARSATAAANAELADGQKAYNQLEKAAIRTATAAEKAALKAGGMRNVKLDAAAQKAAAALRGEAQALDVLKAKAAQTVAAQTRLERAQTNLARSSSRVKDRLGDNTRAVSTFRGALGDIGGPLGEFAERLLFPVQAFVDLEEIFGLTVAAGTLLVVGLAAVAAAVVAVGIAAAAATAYIAKLGVQLADTARSAGLAREALAIMDPEFRTLSTSIDGAARASGLADDRLTALAKSLRAAKVSAEDMPAALRAAAVAERALGQEGSAKFIERIKAGKAAVTDLANETERKLGGVVARQMLSLDVQAATLQRNLGRTFGGLEIEPLLEGLSVLVKLFDENTEAGKAFKFIFEAIFQPIIDAATAALPAVEAFFLGFAIGAVKMYIAAKTVFNFISKALGFEGVDFDILPVALAIGEMAAYALGLAVLGLVAALAILAVATVIAFAPFLIAVAVLALVAYGLYQLAKAAFEVGSAVGTFLVGAVTSAIDTLSNLGSRAVQVGTDLMAGLAKGIAAGAGQVVSAMTGAVDAAIAKAKGLLGIASPSKVFTDIGMNTGEGFARGIDESASDAQSSLEAMVDPPGSLATAAGKIEAPSQVSAPQAPSRPAVSLTGPFIFQGVQGAEDAERRFLDLLTAAVEGDVRMLGGATA